MCLSCWFTPSISMYHIYIWWLIMYVDWLAGEWEVRNSIWFIASWWWNPMRNLSKFLGCISQHGLWAHNTNLIDICLYSYIKIIIQTGHKFAHATTAELLWHVQNCNLIGSLELKLEQIKVLQDLNYKLVSFKIKLQDQVVKLDGSPPGRRFSVDLPHLFENSLWPYDIICQK